MKVSEVKPPRCIDRLKRDDRGYPVIATVARSRNGADFGSISERRKLVLAVFDWCAVCGLPFNGEPRFQCVPDRFRTAERPDSYLLSEAPVHEICALYSAQICPHLSSPGARLGDEFRRGDRRDAVVEFLGFSRTEDVRAFKSQLQENYVLHFLHREVVAGFSYCRPEEVAERYAQLLREEPELEEVSPAGRKLAGMFARLSTKYEEEPGGVLTGAALTIGAAFAPAIFKVEGLGAYSDPKSYAKLASRLLEESALKKIAENFDDVATRLAAQWLLERGADLPEVISAWRSLGRRTASVRTRR